MDVMFENSAMNILLEAELAAGNRIAEVSAWLPKCKKFILLGIGSLATTMSLHCNSTR